MIVACAAEVRGRCLWEGDTSNKPFEWTGHHKLSATPPQASCLPLKGSVESTCHLQQSSHRLKALWGRACIRWACSVVHVLDLIHVALTIGVAVTLRILAGYVMHAEVVRQAAALDVGQGGFACINAGPQRSAQRDLHIRHRLGLVLPSNSVLAVAAPGTDTGFNLVFVAALGMGRKAKAEAGAGGGDESGGEQGGAAHGE